MKPHHIAAIVVALVIVGISVQITSRHKTGYIRVRTTLENVGRLKISELTKVTLIDHGQKTRIWELDPSSDREWIESLLRLIKEDLYVVKRPQGEPLRPGEIRFTKGKSEVVLYCYFHEEQNGKLIVNRHLLSKGGFKMFIDRLFSEHPNTKDLQSSSN